MGYELWAIRQKMPSYKGDHKRPSPLGASLGSREGRPYGRIAKKVVSDRRGGFYARPALLKTHSHPQLPAFTRVHQENP